MPPSEASAPGSIGKNSPLSRKCSLSALRVMPGSMTQSRSSACTASTRFMSRKSRQMPPRGALTWPSSDVPVPKATTGTRCLAHSRTISCTSSVACGNTTASGGWLAIQVVVWPCCSRTACDVTSRLPYRGASAAITASAALRSCVLRCGASTSAMSRPDCVSSMIYASFTHKRGGGRRAGQALLLSCLSSALASAVVDPPQSGT